MEKHLTDTTIETVTEWVELYARTLELFLGDTVQFGPNYIYVELHTWAHEMKLRIPYPDFIPTDDNDAAMVVMEHIQHFFTKALVERFMK